MQRTIVITGAAGFIGSNLVKFLNKRGYYNIVAVDTLKGKGKIKTLCGAHIVDFLDYKKGFPYLREALKSLDIEIIFHLGANTDVSIKDGSIFLEENLEHSRFWFYLAIKREIPLIYASSSAVYGNSMCFKVDPACEFPHNEYAFSKWVFDNFVRFHLESINAKVIGFRLFNVFGLGESHKGKNASLPYRFYTFIRDKGHIELFNGDIKRDYVWVQDVSEVLYRTWREEKLSSGIYNLGSGTPISHRKIAQIIIETMLNGGLKKSEMDYIKLVPLPKDLIGRFQFYTKAEDMPKWIQEITKNSEEKIREYIRELRRIEEEKNDFSF